MADVEIGAGKFILFILDAASLTVIVAGNKKGIL